MKQEAYAMATIDKAHLMRLLELNRDFIARTLRSAQFAKEAAKIYLAKSVTAHFGELKLREAKILYAEAARFGETQKALKRALRHGKRIQKRHGMDDYRYRQWRKGLRVDPWRFPTQSV